jgi:CDGSH-type Zn-finger protein
MVKPTVSMMKDGPLLVRNLKVMKNSKGDVTTKTEMALCRCGGSDNKPFCDGTHGKIGFSSKLEKDRTQFKTKEYKRGGMTILDNPGVCAHAGYCDGKSPEVFWDFENGERVVKKASGGLDKTSKTIQMCPSGALSYKIKGKLYDEFTIAPMILVSKDGPYYVKGSPKLEDKESKVVPESKEHYTLCRCGLSKNKPLCDGSHRGKFKDSSN